MNVRSCFWPCAATSPPHLLAPGSLIWHTVQLRLSTSPLNSAFQLISQRQVTSARAPVTGNVARSRALWVPICLVLCRQPCGRRFSPLRGVASPLEDAGLRPPTRTPWGASPLHPRPCRNGRLHARTAPASRQPPVSAPLPAQACDPRATADRSPVLLSSHYSHMQPCPLGTEERTSEMNTIFVLTGVRGLPSFTFQEFHPKSDEARLRFYIKVCLFLYSILTTLLKR